MLSTRWAIRRAPIQVNVKMSIAEVLGPPKEVIVKYGFFKQPMKVLDIEPARVDEPANSSEGQNILIVYQMDIGLIVFSMALLWLSMPHREAQGKHEGILGEEMLVATDRYREAEPSQET